MLRVVLEHFLSQFELSVALLHDDLPQGGALYDHGQMEAQVVAQSGPGVPEVGLIDPVLEDDLCQVLKRLVVSDDGVEVGGELAGDRVESARLHRQLIHGVVEERDTRMLLLLLRFCLLGPNVGPITRCQLSLVPGVRVKLTWHKLRGSH